ncbi:MAG: response regulator transcription factor [Brevundimonas sp.]
MQPERDDEPAPGRVGDRRTPVLSRRETECLQWVGRGKSSSDIGAILGLSPRTVDSYLEKTCAKLRVRTRIEAVAIAVRAGLIEAR